MATTPPQRLAIAADDLTGAADTAAQVACARRPALVLLEPGGAVGRRASSVAVDADSRHLPPREAEPRIERAFRCMPSGATPYLKLDSTLRGSVGAALRAGLAATGAQAALLAPAFPARRRTVSGGVLLVAGVPVAETEAGRDRAAPVSASRIADIVRHQWRCPIAVIAPAGAALAQDLERALDAGARVVVADARSARDLRLIARAASACGRRVLMAGSAGLARGWAQVMGLPRERPQSPRSRKRTLVLVVVGSTTTAALAQVAALRRAGVECLAADAARASAGARAHGRLAIVPGTGAPHQQAASLAAAVIESLHGDCALVLSGGATARALCEAAGIHTLQIVGELQPGVAAGYAVGDRRLPLVIKGGAAGGARSLIRAIAWIEGKE